MSIKVVQLGSPRKPGEGVRIGTVRRPPRGVLTSDYARLNFYDTWLPQLAPSAELVKVAQKSAGSPAGWKTFEKRYRHELSTPDNQRLVNLFAALSRSADFSIGCYCENESTCHRSILRKVLAEHGALIT